MTPAIATAANGWVNTRDTHDPAGLERAQQILQQTRYCTLATCSPEGLPWASPVLFTYRSLRIYWSSAIASQHSQNLHHNQGRVAIAIYNSQSLPGQTQGLFFQGLAKTVDPAEVSARLVDLLARSPGPSPDRTAADYLGDSPRRLYEAQIQAAWITGDRLPVGRQLVDTKVQLDLADLMHLSL